MFEFRKEYIRFSYKGDEILYLYPWKRSRFSARFISIGCNGVFSSLKEIDNFWDEYFEAERRDHEEEQKFFEINFSE